MMTIDELRLVHEAQPFQPFTMYMADGRKLHVPHQEFLSRHPKGRTVVVFHDDGSFSIIDSFHITEIEFPTGKTRPGQNGAKRPRKS